MPLLGVALLVGIAAGVAPFAYAAVVVRMPPGPTAPTVAFGSAISDRLGTRVSIVAADPTRPVWEFGARLTSDGAVIEELSRIDQSTSWTLTFTDRDGDERLSAGDGFFVQFRMLGHFELRLLWRGSSIAVVAWDVVVPTVTFADPQIGGAWVTVDVASAVPENVLDDFSASLSRDWSTLSWISPLSQYNDSTFAFADRDRDGRLSPGDRFSSSHWGTGEYQIRLEWLGNFVGNASWSATYPNVTFSATQWNATTTWLNVTGAPDPRPCGDYTGILSHGSTYEDQIVGLCGGVSPGGRMRAYDLDADLRLSVGDRITVAVDAPGLWTFSLYWYTVRVADVSWLL